MRFHLLNNEGMAQSIISNPIDCKDYAIISIQAVWTGSPVGTLIIQLSNDNVNWSNMTPSQIPINGPGDIMYTVPATGALSMRLYYQRVGGSGLLSSVVNGKVHTV